MCSINWTKSRGHILFCKILSKRSPWALKDEEPCLFYCKDTPNSLGGMRLLEFGKCNSKKLIIGYENQIIFADHNCLDNTHVR